MYFFNLKALREDLRSGKTSDADMAPYVFIPFVFYSLASAFDGFVPNPDPGKPGLAEWIFAFANLIAAVGGFIYCYRKNGASRGERFLNKAIPLAWVVGFNILRYCIPIAILAVIANRGLSAASKDRIMNIELMSTGVIFQIIFYGWIGKELGAVRARTPLEPPLEV